MFDNDFDIFQKELNCAMRENQDFDCDADSFGFNEVLEQRKEKKEALRQRLYKYYLKDDEIDELFKIIEKAEEKMEKIKKSVNYEKKVPGDATKMQEKLFEVQKKMKEDFDKELSKVLKKKYENAKKILKEREKNN